MPQFNFSKALTANQLGFNPLTGWQYEWLPWRGLIRLLTRTTAAAGTVLLTVFSGSETIMQRSPIQVGGTAGVIPSDLNTAAIRWYGAPGDRLILLFDETAGATPTVDGIIYVDPA